MSSLQGLLGYISMYSLCLGNGIFSLLFSTSSDRVIVHDMITEYFGLCCFDHSFQNEWRAIGVQQSRGWVHYAIHRPEPHIMLFRRPLHYQQQQENQAQQNLLAK